MLATFEQLCAYYANGFLVDRVELGLDLTMSKTSTHTHTHTWNTQHTRTADDNGMCLNKHACQTAKTQLRFAPSHASARSEVFENFTVVARGITSPPPPWQPQTVIGS